MHKEKIWTYATTGAEREVMLFGVNIFEYQWKDTGENVSVIEPLYHQKYRFRIYKVSIESQEYEFAAGEFSNNIWGFYIQQR